MKLQFYNSTNDMLKLYTEPFIHYLFSIFFLFLNLAYFASVVSGFLWFVAHLDFINKAVLFKLEISISLSLSWELIAFWYHTGGGITNRISSDLDYNSMVYIGQWIMCCYDKRKSLFDWDPSLTAPITNRLHVLFV